jgi:hypothetical protein
MPRKNPTTACFALARVAALAAVEVSLVAAGSPSGDATLSAS